MGNPLELVRLRNGSEVPRAAVIPIEINVKALLDLGSDGVLSAFELVELCRDPQHEVWGNTGELLEKLALVRRLGDGRHEVHAITRNIVLSMAQGEDTELTFVSPFAP